MYYDKVVNDIGKIIQDFFVEERNNRITSNNIQGLSFKIKSVFDLNRVESKRKEPLKPIKP